MSAQENPDIPADVNIKTNGKKANQKSKVANKKSEPSKLKKKLRDLEIEKNELKEQLLRKAAEFDNYKKRTESEFSRLIQGANAELITELLPILDDLERSLSSVDLEKKENLDDFHRGVGLIFKNLTKVLEKRGVMAIDAVGQTFDPEKHEALMQVESKDHRENTVVEEHLKGYLMHDKVLRHSQVLVSK